MSLFLIGFLLLIAVYEAMSLLGYVSNRSPRELQASLLALATLEAVGAIIGYLRGFTWVLDAYLIAVFFGVLIAGGVYGRSTFPKSYFMYALALSATIGVGVYFVSR